MIVHTVWTFRILNLLKDEFLIFEYLFK